MYASIRRNPDDIRFRIMYLKGLVFDIYPDPVIRPLGYCSILCSFASEKLFMIRSMVARSVILVAPHRKNYPFSQ